MEDTEVNYENVRNIPIHLFDGRILEKKKLEIESKHVYSTTIRKEKKEILNEDTNAEGTVTTTVKDNKESESNNIPIKINIVTSPKSLGTPTQNGSLSSSVPSLAEVSRKSREPKNSSVGTSTSSRQKTLNEIQNELEDAQKKLATHLQQIGSTSETTLSSRNRIIEKRSRSVESSKRKEITKAAQQEYRREESSPDLEKYMEVWKNISRDLDEIVQKANVDTRNSELTRNSEIYRAKSVPVNDTEKTKISTNINGSAVEELGKQKFPEAPKENKYLTEIPSQSTQHENHRDMSTTTNNMENKPTDYKGAKGLRNMLQETGQENIKNEESFEKLSPKAPKRDFRSNFFGKEHPKNVSTNRPDTVTNDLTTEPNEVNVNLTTNAACFACDACTQTGAEEKEKEKGCNVM